MEETHIRLMQWLNRFGFTLRRAVQGEWIASKTPNRRSAQGNRSSLSQHIVDLTFWSGF